MASELTDAELAQLRSADLEWAQLDEECILDNAFCLAKRADVAEMDFDEGVRAVMYPGQYFCSSSASSSGAAARGESLVDTNSGAGEHLFSSASTYGEALFTTMPADLLPFEEEKPHARPIDTDALSRRLLNRLEQTLTAAVNPPSGHRAQLFKRSLVQARLHAAHLRLQEANRRQSAGASGTSTTNVMDTTEEEYVTTSFPEELSDARADASLSDFGGVRPPVPFGAGGESFVGLSTVHPLQSARSVGSVNSAAAAGNSGSSGVSAAVRLGVLSIFPLIDTVRALSELQGETGRRHYAELCRRILITVQRVLGALPPLALHNEPMDCLDAFQEFVSSMVIQGGEDSQAVNALASLAVARGNARDLLGLVAVLLQVVGLSEEKLRFRIGESLERIVNFERELSVCLPWKRGELCSWPVQEVALDPSSDESFGRVSDAGESSPQRSASKLKIVPPGRVPDVVAAGAGYVYVHSADRGLRKVGTGRNGTIQGRVYVSNSDAFPSIKGPRSLLYAAESLFFVHAEEKETSSSAVRTDVSADASMSDAGSEIPAPVGKTTGVFVTVFDPESLGQGATLFLRIPRSHVDNLCVHAVSNGAIIALVSRAENREQADATDDLWALYVDKFYVSDVLQTAAGDTVEPSSSVRLHLSHRTSASGVQRTTRNPGEAEIAIFGSFEWSRSVFYFTGQQLVALMPSARSETDTIRPSKLFPLQRAVAFDMSTEHTIFVGSIDYLTGGAAVTFDHSADLLLVFHEGLCHFFKNLGPRKAIKSSGDGLDYSNYESLLRSLFDAAPHPEEAASKEHSSTSRFRVPVLLSPRSALFALVASMDRLASRFIADPECPRRNALPTSSLYCIDSSRHMFEVLLTVSQTLSEQTSLEPSAQLYLRCALLRVLRVNLATLDSSVNESEALGDVLLRIRQFLLDLIRTQAIPLPLAQETAACFESGFALFFNSDQTRVDFAVGILEEGDSRHSEILLPAILSRLNLLWKDCAALTGFEGDHVKLRSLLLDREFGLLSRSFSSNAQYDFKFSQSLRLLLLLQRRLLLTTNTEVIVYIQDVFARVVAILAVARQKLATVGPAFMVARLKCSVVGILMDTLTPALLRMSRQGVDPVLPGGGCDFGAMLLSLLSALEEFNVAFGDDSRSADRLFMRTHSGMLLRGSDVGRDSGIYVQSKHPYVNGSFRQTVSIPGARALCLFFDPRCHTSGRGGDVLRVYSGTQASSASSSGDTIGFDFGRESRPLEFADGNFPRDEALVINGSSVTFVFSPQSSSEMEDRTQVKNRWGFRARVTELIPTDEFEAIVPKGAWSFDLQIALTTIASTFASHLIKKPVLSTSSVRNLLDHSILFSGGLKEAEMPLDLIGDDALKWFQKHGRLGQPLRGSQTALEWTGRVERSFLTSALWHLGLLTVAHDFATQLSTHEEPTAMVNFAAAYGNDALQAFKRLALESAKLATFVQLRVQATQFWNLLFETPEAVDSTAPSRFHTHETFFETMRAETLDRLSELCALKGIDTCSLGDDAIEKLWEVFEAECRALLETGDVAMAESGPVSVYCSVCEPLISRCQFLLELSPPTTKFAPVGESQVRPKFFWTLHAWREAVSSRAQENAATSEPTIVSQISDFVRMSDMTASVPMLKQALSDRQNAAMARASALSFLSELLDSSKFVSSAYSVLCSFSRLFLDQTALSGLGGINQPTQATVSRAFYSVANKITRFIIVAAKGEPEANNSGSLLALVALPLLGGRFSVDDFSEIGLDDALVALAQLATSTRESIVSVALSHVAWIVFCLVVVRVSDFKGSAANKVKRKVSSSACSLLTECQHIASEGSRMYEILSMLSLVVHGDSVDEREDEVLPTLDAEILVDIVRSSVVAPRVRSLAVRLVRHFMPVSSDFTRAPYANLISFMLDYIGRTTLIHVLDDDCEARLTELKAYQAKSSDVTADGSNGFSSDEFCVYLREWILPASRLSEVVNSCNGNSDMQASGLLPSSSSDNKTTMSAMQQLLEGLSAGRPALLAITTESAGKRLCASIATLGGTPSLERLPAFGERLLADNAGKEPSDVSPPLSLLSNVTNRNLQRCLSAGGGSVVWSSGKTVRSLASTFVQFLRDVGSHDTAGLTALLTARLALVPTICTQLQSSRASSEPLAGTLVSDTVDAVAALSVIGGFSANEVQSGRKVIVLESEGTSSDRPLRGIVRHHIEGALHVEVLLEHSGELRKVPYGSIFPAGDFATLVGFSSLFTRDLVSWLLAVVPLKTESVLPSLQVSDSCLQAALFLSTVQALASKVLSQVPSLDGSDLLNLHIWSALASSEIAVPSENSRLARTERSVLTSSRRLWNLASKPPRRDAHFADFASLLPHLPYSSLANIRGATFSSSWRANRAPGMIFCEPDRRTVKNSGFDISSVSGGFSGGPRRGIPRVMPKQELVVIGDAPISSSDIPEFYFEVFVDEAEAGSLMSIGFVNTTSIKPQRGFSAIQWGPGSFRFQANARKTSFAGGSSRTAEYGQAWKAKSVVGCGFNSRESSIFFTLDGVHLGNAFEESSFPRSFYPAFGLSRGVQVSVNFGQAPFRYSELRIESAETPSERAERKERERKRALDALNEQKALRLQMIEPLTAMGFDQRMAKVALKQTGYSGAEAASNWLVEHLGNFDFDAVVVSDEEETPATSIPASNPTDETLPDADSSSTYDIEQSSNCLSGDAFSFHDSVPPADSGPQISSEWEESIVPAIKSFMERDGFAPFEMADFIQQIRAQLTQGNEAQAKNIISQILGGSEASLGIQFPDASARSRDSSSSQQVQLTNLRRGQWVVLGEAVASAAAVIARGNATFSSAVKSVAEVVGLATSSGDTSAPGAIALSWLWVPDMIAVTGRAGRVRYVDYASSLVLVQFADSQAGTLADWWLPVAALQIPNFVALTDSDIDVHPKVEQSRSGLTSRVVLECRSANDLQSLHSLVSLREEQACLCARSALASAAANLRSVDIERPKLWVPLLESQHLPCSLLPRDSELELDWEHDRTVELAAFVRSAYLNKIHDDSFQGLELLISELSDSGLDQLRAYSKAGDTLLRSVRIDSGVPADETRLVSLAESRSLLVMFESAGTVIPPGSGAVVEFFSDEACTCLIRRFGENSSAALDGVNPRTNFATWHPFIISNNEFWVRMTSSTEQRLNCRYALQVAAYRPSQNLSVWIGELLTDALLSLLNSRPADLATEWAQATLQQWLDRTIDCVYSTSIPSDFKVSLIHLVIRLISLWTASYDATIRSSQDVARTLVRLKLLGDEAEYLFQRERKRGGTRPVVTLQGQDTAGAGGDAGPILHSMYLQSLAELFSVVSETAEAVSHCLNFDSSDSHGDTDDALKIAIVLAGSLKQSEEDLKEHVPTSLGDKAKELSNRDSGSRPSMGEITGQSAAVNGAQAVVQDVQLSTGSDAQMAGRHVADSTVSDSQVADSTLPAAPIVNATDSNVRGDSSSASESEDMDDEELRAAMALSLGGDNEDVDVSDSVDPTSSSAIEDDSDARESSSQVDGQPLPNGVSRPSSDPAGEQEQFSWLNDFSELRQHLRSEYMRRSGRVVAQRGTDSAIAERSISSAWNFSLLCTFGPQLSEPVSGDKPTVDVSRAADSVREIPLIAQQLIIVDNLPLVSEQHAAFLTSYLLAQVAEVAGVKGDDACYMPVANGKLKGFAVIRVLAASGVPSTIKKLHRHRLSSTSSQGVMDPQELANLRVSLRASSSLPRGIIKAIPAASLLRDAFAAGSSIRCDPRIVDYLQSRLIKPDHAQPAKMEDLVPRFRSVVEAVFQVYCSPDELLCEKELNQIQLASTGTQLSSQQIAFALKTYPTRMSSDSSRTGLTLDGFLLLYARQSVSHPLETFDEVMRLGFDLSLLPLRHPYHKPVAAANAVNNWPASRRGEAADAELLDLAEELYTSARLSDVSELEPSLFNVGRFSEHTIRDSYPLLSQLPLSLVRFRWCMLLRMNVLASKPGGLCLLNPSAGRVADSLAMAHWFANSGRHLLLYSVKLHFSNAILALTSCLPGTPQPTVTIDRLKIAHQEVNANTTTGADRAVIKRTMFGHAFSQVFLPSTSGVFSHSVPVEGVSRHRVHYASLSGTSADAGLQRALRAAATRQPRPLGTDPHFSYKIVFRNENVQGEGGPYRQFFTDCSCELQGVLSLFIPVPNAQAGDGDYQDQWTLCSACASSQQRDAFTFVGWMFGASMRTGAAVSLDLADFVWKPLAVEAHRPSSDLQAIDKHFFRRLEYLNEAAKNPSSFSDSEDFSSWFASDGLTKVKQTHSELQASEVSTFISEVIDARLNEHRSQLDALRRGLEDIVPAPLVRCFLTGRDLAWRISGRPGVDVDLLRRHCDYQGVNPDSAHIAMFWQVLRDFSTAERRAFLRFAWAQERLPLSDEEFVRTRTRLVIKPYSGLTDPDSVFPKADTCFFHLQLPEYTSAAVLRARLLTAITLDSHSMNADAEAEDELTTVDESRARRYEDSDEDDESESESD